MRIRPMLVLSTLLVAACAGAANDAPPPMPVDLTGVWNLDTMASDDLAGQLDGLLERMIAAQGGGRSGGGFGGEEPGVGVPGRRGSQGSMGNASGSRDSSRPLAKDQDPGRDVSGVPDPSGPRELALAMKQLLITVDGADIEIMDGTDWTRVWTPGGKPVQRDGPGGDVVEQAWWDDDMLVLSTTGGRLAITRRLSLEDDGRTLVAKVTVRVSGTAERIDARLVYHGY